MSDEIASDEFLRSLIVTVLIRTLYCINGQEGHAQQRLSTLLLKLSRRQNNVELASRLLMRMQAATGETVSSWSVSGFQ